MALTRACQMRCTYCYSQLQGNPGGPLNWDEIRDLFEDFKELGVRGVSLVSDGESTCNPLWERAVILGKEKGLDMALGTNGLRFEPDPAILRCLTYLRFNVSAAHPHAWQRIHGVKDRIEYTHLVETIRTSVYNKVLLHLPVTIGLQMVFLPDYVQELVPLACLAKGLGVDYLQIKHCSDDEDGTLGVDYDAIRDCRPALRHVESFSDTHFQVCVKWDKITRGTDRPYHKCRATPFHLQISGSGLVAPCGMLFSEKYSAYHIGSLHQQRFRDIISSDRYWEVMEELAGDDFDACTMCGCLCLQDATNIYLEELAASGATFVEMPKEEPPLHVNFL